MNHHATTQLVEYAFIALSIFLVVFLLLVRLRLRQRGLGRAAALFFGVAALIASFVLIAYVATTPRTARVAVGLFRIFANVAPLAQAITDLEKAAKQWPVRTAPCVEGLSAKIGDEQAVHVYVQSPFIHTDPKACAEEALAWTWRWFIERFGSANVSVEALRAVRIRDLRFERGYYVEALDLPEPAPPESLRALPGPPPAAPDEPPSIYPPHHLVLSTDPATALALAERAEAFVTGCRRGLPPVPGVAALEGSVRASESGLILAAGQSHRFAARYALLRCLHAKVVRWAEGHGAKLDPLYLPPLYHYDLSMLLPRTEQF